MNDNSDFLALYELVHDADENTKPNRLTPKIDPHLVERPEIWRHLMDLSSLTASKIAEHASDGEPSTMAAMMVTWRGHVAELTDEHTTPLERILIEQVATTWLHLQIMTYKAEGNIAAGVNLKLADHWEKRVNAAQRRHLRAVETLARVRKIERTRPLQVNIGTQQINTVS